MATTPSSKPTATSLASCGVQHAFQRIAEGVIDVISAAVPNLDCTIFTATDDGKIGMEDSKRDIVGMTFHATLAEIILDSFVVACGD